MNLVFFTYGLTLVMILGLPDAFAQPEVLTELKEEYALSTSRLERDSLAIELLNQYYFTGNLAEGVEFGRQLLRENDSTQRTRQLAQIHNRLGTIYTMLGNHVSDAFSHLTRALDICSDIGWNLGKGIVYNNLGNVYRELKLYTKAQEYYLMSLSTSIQLKDSVGIAFAYKNLAILFEGQGWEQKALQYHEDAYNIRKRLGNPREILSSLVNIGASYNVFKKYDRALRYLMRADSLAQNLHSEMQSEVSLELGNSYYHLHNLMEAERQYQKGLDLSIRSNKSRTIGTILNQKAVVAMNQGAYEKSRHDMRRLRLLLDTTHYALGNIEYYRLAYKLDSIQGDELSSLRNYKIMASIEDSLNMLSSSQDIMVRQNAFELMQKDEAINAEREKQRSQRQLFYSIVISLLLITISLGFTVHQKVKSAKKIREKQNLILENNLMLTEANEELEATLEKLREADKKIHNQNLEIKSHNLQLIEQVKKRTDEIIAATSQIGQFSFLVSHNLRGPVARLLGLRNLLRITESKKEIEEILHSIDLSIEEVDSIINDINKVLAADSGVNVKIELINTEELIKSVLQILKEEIELTNAEVTYTIADTPFFFSSLQYMRSIFEQLILNSMKFRDEDKKSKVEISVSSNDKKIHFAVIDNGLGVDLGRYGNQIFMPYKRFHSHRMGRGFNLFLTKLRIEALGGSISIESEVKAQTCIRFTIPKISGSD